MTTETPTPCNPLDSRIIRNPQAEFSHSFENGFYVVHGRDDGWYLAITTDGLFQFYFQKPESGASLIPSNFEPTDETEDRTIAKLIEDTQLGQEMRSYKFVSDIVESSIIPKEEAGPIKPAEAQSFLEELAKRRKTDEFRSKVTGVLDLLKEE